MVKYRAFPLIDSPVLVQSEMWFSHPSSSLIITLLICGGQEINNNTYPVSSANE